MSNKNKKEEAVFLLDGKPFTVPPGGSLVVLALGSVGIRAWKKAKKDYDQKLKDDEEKA